MTTAPEPTSALVARFSRGFSATFLTEHAVGSPLGLWLLLALLAPASPSHERAVLEDALGTDAEDAARRAASLLDRPHPAVGTAIAVWARAHLVSAPVYDAWAAALPSSVEAGDVPTQAQADEWASARTEGLIPTFPGPVEDRATAVVAASALVTRVTWIDRFENASAEELEGPFGALVGTALRAPTAAGHMMSLAQTQSAGLVGVHAALSADGLRVVSVIAAPDVAPAAVHEAALEVAASMPGSAAPSTVMSLFDVPVGPGHAWVVTEQVERRYSHAVREERVDAVLPRWSAASGHGLDAARGVPAAFATLETFLSPANRPGLFSAVQVAVASFAQDGFEAAALTGMWMSGGAAAPEPVAVRVRRATIRFNRPYAVVAVALNQVPDRETGWGDVDLGVPSWDCVPVFSAWVGSPDA